MTDADDLVRRLRAASCGPNREDFGIGSYWNLCAEAADAIERLTQENAELRAAPLVAERDNGEPGGRSNREIEVSGLQWRAGYDSITRPHFPIKEGAIE